VGKGQKHMARGGDDKNRGRQWSGERIMTRRRMLTRRKTERPTWSNYYPPHPKTPLQPHQDHLHKYFLLL